MQSVSSRYKRIVQNPGRTFRYKVTIDLANGERLELDDADIMMNGITVTHATSCDGELQIGNVSASRLDLQINNFTGKFNGKDFIGGEIRVYFGLIVEKNYETGEVPEWTRHGLFLVETATAHSGLINILGWDHNFAFEIPYEIGNLRYPVTLRTILQDCCQQCGVPLLTYDFPNADYVVDNRPESDAVTFRDVMQWVVELAGCYSRVTPDGALELAWYDLDNPAVEIPEVDEMWTDDVTITGIKLKSHTEGTETIFGETGYIIDLTRNELVQNNMKSLGQILGEKLNGMTFRPFRHYGWSNPAVEAGDTAIIYDKDKKPHKTIISRIVLQAGAKERYCGEAETVASRKRSRPGGIDRAKGAAKSETKKQISNYDTMAKQFASMTANSMGFYYTTVKQDDGSEIWYQHDKELLEESRVIWKKSLDTMAVSTDGGKTWHGIDKNGNAVLNVLAAHGIVADWIKTGRIEAQQGGAYFDLDKGELSATKLISDKYPDCITTIGPNENGDAGALNVSGGGKNMLSVYEVGDSQGNPGTVWTAPFLTDSAGKNRKGVSIGKNGISLFADKNGEMQGVRVLSEGTVEAIGNLTVWGDLKVVNGSKSRAVKTTRGYVDIAAYETAEPMFGDIGEATINENGKAVINVEPLFAETVNTSNYAYQVFLQPYAKGEFWVSERTPNHFVVEGPKNGGFAWEIKARQKDFETCRLSPSDIKTL